MLQQPMNEFAIRAEMALRGREFMRDADVVESSSWCHQTVIAKPSWVRQALGRLGHGLVLLGHTLAQRAIQFQATHAKPLKSI